MEIRKMTNAASRADKIIEAYRILGSLRTTCNLDRYTPFDYELEKVRNSVFNLFQFSVKIED
jgi:hypothetical protein